MVRARTNYTPLVRRNLLVLFNKFSKMKDQQSFYRAKAYKSAIDAIPPRMPNLDQGKHIGKARIQRRVRQLFATGEDLPEVIAIRSSKDTELTMESVQYISKWLSK